MDRFQELKALMDKIEVNAIKFYLQDNIAAGKRLRIQMQELKNLAQAISFQIGNLTN